MVAQVSIVNERFHLGRKKTIGSICSGRDCNRNKNSYRSSHLTPNVAFSRGAGWRGLCSAQPVTDRTVGYNAWLAILFHKIQPVKLKTPEAMFVVQPLDLLGAHDGLFSMPHRTHPVTKPCKVGRVLEYALHH